ncbi:fluoride efflux transporter CrcB [Ornithinibacillus halotolerans]|nr:fluoride efflux transporter CrcB [Ornithinibacillus halotolerans]
MTYILIGLGGAIGASLRYFVSIIFHTDLVASFPYATLTVNLIGCLILGIFSSGFELKRRINPRYLFAFKTGVIGSFTTFSTFSVEVLTMIQHHQYYLTIIYILLSSILGLFLAYLGIKIGEYLSQREVTR